MRDIQAHFSEHTEVIHALAAECSNQIVAAGNLMARCLGKGGCIFWCGNGGSASDSQHLAAELVGRFKKNRRALKSIALSTDTSVLTCVANDFSYDEIFSRQVEALGTEKDLLVVISTSGGSPNVLNALSAASALNMGTVALLGKGGGAANGMANEEIVVPSQSTARIQEAHILIGHIFCELIETELNLQ
jgi:D-sedoheptulose 7-phosphate isomerase